MTRKSPLFIMTACMFLIGCTMTPAPVSWAQDFVETLPAERLTDQAKLAIDAAPVWVRVDLEDNLERMSETYQDIYAAMILDPAEARFRDEIAFCVANVGTANLEDPDFVPDLLEENVYYIYEHDQYLDYVRIEDVGDPDLDDDYYTTTHYMIEEDGSLVEYELPRDIYYWKIVHPKIEDEWAYYIDPNAVGDVPAEPPTGKFWRDWLFTYTEEIPETDEMYPVLRDAMSGVTALWGNTTTGAIGTLSQWARDTLAFSSGSERPHQPVRIYILHMGRCGEWQDYTSAASRACLIPCHNVEAISEDHVWNEFWHQRWIHWEPVNGDGYIDNPLVYENGWGKVFSGVFAVDGDGFIYDVIDRYSEGWCTVNATVVDANGDPVDGARLGVKDAGYFGCYNYGGSNGHITALYGDSLSAKVKIQSELGKFPDGAATFDLVPITEDGETYEWNAQYPTATLPAIPWTVNTPSETSGFRLQITVEVLGEVRCGAYPFDQQNIYTRQYLGGSVDLFVVDAANKALYEEDLPFEAVIAQPFIGSGDFIVELPRFDAWSVVVTTERKLTSETMAYVQVTLEEDVEGTWTPIGQVAQTLSLMPGEKYTATTSAGGSFGVSLEMPATILHGGDTCWCKAHVLNPGLQESGVNIPLFVILDVYGELFFAPDYSDFAFFTVSDLQAAQKQSFTALPEFIWPEIEGSASGLYWYAGMTNPEMTELFGAMDILEFGWE